MKKCKFCGNDGIVKKDGIAYYVACSNCGARTFNAETEKKAIAMWNEMMTEDKEGK